MLGLDSTNVSRHYATDNHHIITQKTKYEPRLRNGLESPDYDEMLAAYLTLVDQHCLHLVPVPASSSVPAIPGHIDNRAVYNSWAGEYVVDYEAWVNNFPEATVKVTLLKVKYCQVRSRSRSGVR